MEVKMDESKALESIAIVGYSFDASNLDSLSKLQLALDSNRHIEKSSFDGKIEFNFDQKDTNYDGDTYYSQILKHSIIALSNANYLNEMHRPKTGTFLTAYFDSSANSDPNLNGKKSFDNEIEFNSQSTPTGFASRLSFDLNLKGPIYCLDNHFSSSIALFHQARLSLLVDECQLAIVVCASYDPQIGNYCNESSTVLSDSNQCLPFQDSRDGTVLNNGFSVFVLMKQRDAERSKSKIHGLIRSSAIATDGRKTQFLRTDANSQLNLIHELLQNANLSIEDIDYYEAHATGTKEGDSVELKTIRTLQNERKAPLLFGSVKEQLGHLRHASGAFSVLKSIGMLDRKSIPNNSFSLKNQDSLDSDMILHRHSDAIPCVKQDPMNIAISAFGIGGFNAQLIIQEYQSDIEKQTVNPDPPYLLPLSFSSEKNQRNIISFIKNQTQRKDKIPDFCRLASSFYYGEMNQEYKSAVVFDDIDSLKEELSNLAFTTCNSLKNKAQITAFLFPGQGRQYPKMGLDLYNRSSVFKSTLDKVDLLSRKYLETSLKDILWGNQSDLLDNTRYIQPAIFAVEYSLIKFWEGVGVKPNFLLGHSFGEYAAACHAGIMSLPDCIKMVCLRGIAMEKYATKGNLLVVNLSPTKMKDFVDQCSYGHSIFTAVINNEDTTVIGGPAKFIKSIKDQLDALAIKSKLLRVDIAAHTPLMNNAADVFGESISDIEFNLPKIQIFSSRTGELVSNEMSQGSYWVEQIKKPVLFNKAFKSLLAKEPNILLEVGPGSTLLSMIPDSEQTQKIDQLESLSETNSNETTMETLKYFYETWDYIDLSDIIQRDSSNVQSFSGMVSSFISSNAPQVRADSGVQSKKERLLEFLKKTMNQVEIDENQPFTNLGLTSFKILKTANFLRKNLNIHVSAADFYRYPTFSQFVGNFAAEFNQ